MSVQTENPQPHYRCLSQPHYCEGGFQLRPVQPQDIESIRQWRNAQTSVLRQSDKITPEGQRQYYATHIWPTMASPQPPQILFSYLRDDKLIGYGGLVHIGWHARKAEVSVLFDLTPRSEEDYRHHLSTYLTLLKRAAFDDLNFHRLWTEAYDIRPLHISVFEENGFVFEGRLQDHEYIDGRYVDTLFHGCLNTT